MRLRDRAFVAVSATLCMLALPTVCLVLRNVGPAARVVFRDYLPVDELAIVVFGAVLGAAFGADLPRRLRSDGQQRAGRRWPRARWIGLALLSLSVLVPQLRAFPAYASVTERDAWARQRVRHYAALTRVVAAIPEVQEAVGRIVAMAPTASDEHVFAREMNGDDMRFTLDVIGNHGQGTFQAVCTLDDYTIYEWQSGRWTFRDHAVHIDHVTERVPR